MLEANNLTQLEGRALEEAVKKDFGLEVTNAEKIEKGYSSQVHRANFGGKVVYIRINKDGSVFEAEDFGYGIFKKQGIPVPNIISYNINPRTIGQPTMIMEEAEGKSIAELGISGKESLGIYEQVGKILHTINQTKLEGFGSLKKSNNTFVGSETSWANFIELSERRNKKVVDFLKEKNFITDSEALKIEKNYEDISLVDFGKGSLLHKDMHRGHFFIKEGKISGVIDLGSLVVGDPRYDIAISLFFLDNEQREAFKKGYGELANDKIVNKYLLSIAARKVYFRSRRDANGNADAALKVLKNALSMVD